MYFAKFHCLQLLKVFKLQNGSLPNHLSFQKSISNPLPKLHLMLFGNHASLDMFVVPTSKMSFHQFESYLLVIEPSRLSTLRANRPYLNFNRSYHNAFFSLRDTATFICSKEKYSKAPQVLFFGRHTCFQLSQQVLC